MAVDYHVYVHYVGEGGVGNNKTKPSKGKGSKSKKKKDQEKELKKKIKKFKKRAEAVLKVTDTIVDTTSNILAGYYGNYEMKHNYTNLKACVKSIMDPVSLFSSAVESDIQRYREISKKEQEILLTGNDFMKGN